MNTNGQFECDICNLTFNSKKSYLIHNICDYHSNRIREEYEEELDSVAKTESKDKTKIAAKSGAEGEAKAEAKAKTEAEAIAEADSEDENRIIFSEKIILCVVIQHLEASSL